MLSENWDEVRRIYLEGIATGKATLETEAKDWDEWNASHLKRCRLVSLADDVIAGWAALSAVSARSVYSGVAEVSVYVDERFRGFGLGRKLLEALIACSEECGIWTLQAGILADNATSLELHRKCGFRVVGTRMRIGKRNDTWRDVVLMERRSRVVGME
jgi:phosphinothricin acetyltransferase